MRVCVSPSGLLELCGALSTRLSGYFTHYKTPLLNYHYHHFHYHYYYNYGHVFVWWDIYIFALQTAKFMICPPFHLKVDMPFLTCIFFPFNWLTLTSEMHFVKFHPEVASCLLSRGKRKYAPLGMRLLWKYIRNYFLVYHLISHFLLYLQNYKEFEAEILDLQSEKYGLSFDIKKYGWECDRHKGL